MSSSAKLKGLTPRTMRKKHPFVGQAEMKALTLHQPWASLIAIGAKATETRSWGRTTFVVGRHLGNTRGEKGGSRL